MPALTEIRFMRQPRAWAFVRDDFMAGTAASGQIGELGWNTTAGTVTMIASEAAHPGIQRIDTTAVSGTVANIALRGNYSVAGAFEASDLFDLQFLFRLNQVDANTQLRIGLPSQPTGNPSAEGAYLELLGTDTNWFFVTRHAAAQTRADSGVAANTSWHWIRVRRLGSTTLGFTLDTGAEITATANLPTGGALNPTIQIVNGAAASKTVDVDVFGLIIPVTR